MYGEDGASSPSPCPFPPPNCHGLPREWFSEVNSIIQMLLLSHLFVLSGLITCRHTTPKGYSQFKVRQEALGQSAERTTLGRSVQGLFGIQLEALPLHSTVASTGF